MDQGEESKDPYTQRLNANLDKQIKEQREVVAMKRQALSQQRIDIIKGQTQSWSPHTRQSQVFEQHRYPGNDPRNKQYAKNERVELKVDNPWNPDVNYEDEARNVLYKDNSRKQAEDQLKKLARDQGWPS